MVISNECGPRNWQLETARTIEREVRLRPGRMWHFMQPATDTYCVLTVLKCPQADGSLPPRDNHASRRSQFIGLADGLQTPRGRQLP